METRKIQKVNGGTYTVSLPKGWAETEEVTAGEDVELHTHIDGLLVIQARERENDPLGRVTAWITHDEPADITRTLRAAYAAGSTEIVLESTESFTSEQRQAINRVARNLPGVTVDEKSEARIVVRTLLDASEVSLRQSVRQLRFIALSMHRDAMIALAGKAGLNDLTGRDNQADRLYAMINRHVTRGLSHLGEIDALGLTRPELFKLWATTRELERIVAHAEGIGSIATMIDDPIEEATTDDLGEIARRVREIVEEAVSVIIGDADINTARRALNACNQVYEEIDAFDRRLFESTEEDYRLIRVLDGLRQTTEHGENIAERGLQIAIRRGELTEPTSDDGE